MDPVKKDFTASTTILFSASSIEEHSLYEKNLGTIKRNPNWGMGSGTSKNTGEPAQQEKTQNKRELEAFVELR